MTATITTPIMRSVTCQLSDDTLARLDEMRRASPEIPSRAELIHEAVNLFLDPHDDPITALGQMVRGLREIHADDILLSDTVGGTSLAGDT